MKQLTFFKYSTIVLIVLNLVVVAFFLFKGPRGDHRGMGSDPRIRTNDILNLDKNQESSFMELAMEHRESMKQIDQQQRQLLSSYFQTLYENSGNLDKDTLLNQIQGYELEKVNSTYQHFEKVKSILRPEQLKSYEEFVKKTLQFILKTPGNQPPPPKEF